MNLRLSLFLLVVLGESLVYCFSPSNLWPLGEHSGAREALFDLQTNHPVDTLYVGPGHPSLNYRALSLGGSDKLIQVNSPFMPGMTDFFFAFYFYPMESTGPVLTYTASPMQAGFFSKIQINITEGVLGVMVYRYPDTIVLSSLSLTAAINQWNYFAIERTYANGNIRIFNSTFISSTTAGTTDILGPGEMVFGSAGAAFLLARFTCAVLYDNLFYEAPQGYEVYSECQNNTSWVILDTYSPTVIDVSTLPTTTSSTPTAQFSVSKAWPLNNVSFGYSHGGEPPVFPQNSECFTLSEDSPNLLFDGSGRSYLEQTIAADVFQFNFTIAMMLKPGQNTEGTVFHYFYSGVSQVKEVELLIYSSDLILKLHNPSGVCGYLNVPNAVVPNTWNYVRVHFKHDDMYLFINDSWSDNSTQCLTTYSDTSAMGRLLIGANVNGGNNFRGSINCFVVFYGIFLDGEFEILGICQGSSVPKGIDKGQCDIEPDIREGHYVLKAAHAVPLVGVPPMLKVEFSTKIQCGKLCLETRNCRSFVVDVEYDDTSCRLYAFQTDDLGLMHSLDKYYFVINYVDEV